MNILITGAGSGIGQATALRLAKRAHIAVADKNLDGAQETVAQIEGAGGKATAIEADVTDAASVTSMIGQAEAAGGPIDGLFNNAGISLRTPLEDVSEEEWDLMMNTHARGVFLVAQGVLRGMVERKAGVIVNTSSDFAIIGVPNAGAYCAAKTAIYSLTKALAAEFVDHGIRINAIGPGPIDTPILRANRSQEDYEKAVAANVARVPLGRLGKPEEVAATVDFLMSGRASYINGQLLQPNGGAVIW